MLGGGFPNGSKVKNSPSNAGGAGLIPGQGTKISHVLGQLSLHVATTEPDLSTIHALQQEALMP